MIKKFSHMLITYSFCLLFIVGCGANTPPVTDNQVSSAPSNFTPPLPSSTPTPTPGTASESFATPSIEESQEIIVVPDEIAPATITYRDNTSYCRIPEATGTITYGNATTTIDASNTSLGYVMINYTGSSSKVKIILNGPNSYKCTYTLIGNAYQTFPLTAGNGTYTVGVYENVIDTQYTTLYNASFDVSITNEFSPYLYPNQYVNFSSSSKAVAKAEILCEKATSDLDAVSLIYNYIVDNITYDNSKADMAISGQLTNYISSVDATLDSGTGICLDYAALMVSMLRSQQIPTRLEVGYAKDAYHAWISTYIKDVGWINGMIEFDGKSWSLMDPTFAANNSAKTLKKFIGDGSNYTTKYIY